MEKNEKRMSVVLPPSLYKLFKEKCESEYQTVSSIIKRLMTSYVKNGKK
jgi:metal-responsive CopG/Arc/MetJ family transcriptional regulator